MNDKERDRAVADIKRTALAVGTVELTVIDKRAYDRLQKEHARFRSALEQYADIRNWRLGYSWNHDNWFDGYDLAQKVLADADA